MEPPIPGALDLTGFLDGLEDQKTYVFSPSILPKIQVMFLGPFFSCFQRRILEVRKSNFWKSQKRTSVLLGKRGSAEMTPFQRINAWRRTVFFRQILCFTTDYSGLMDRRNLHRNHLPHAVDVQSQSLYIITSCCSTVAGKRFSSSSSIC